MVRAAVAARGVELAQGLIGFVQYFTDLPIVLVGFHLLGAALIAAASTWMCEVRRRSPATVSWRRFDTRGGGLAVVECGPSQQRRQGGP